MARFFFHFFDGKDRCEDDLGVELASAEAAYLEAVASARSMWSELIDARCDPSRCVFEVTDVRHQVLFRFDFSELLDRCEAMEGRRNGSTAGLSDALRDTHLRVSTARTELSASLMEVRAALSVSNDLLARLDTLGRASARRRAV